MKETFQKEKKNFFKQHQSLLINVGVALLSAVVTVILKGIHDSLGYNFMIGIAIVAIVFLALYVINLFVLSKLQIEKIGTVVDRYLAQHELKDSEWYFNMSELEKFEFDDHPQDKKNKKKEVWVISRYLEHDHPDSHLHEKIRINTKKKKLPIAI